MRRLKKVYRWIFSLVALFIGLFIIVLLLVKLVPDPPSPEMEYAMEMLSKAGSSKAGTYSKKEFDKAKADYDKAMYLWKQENSRFIYFRDYSEVIKYAKSAADKARNAAKSSIASSNSLKIKLKEMIDSLNKTVYRIDSIFGRYPLSAELRNKISKGRMLLREGEVAYSKSQYPEANRKLSDSESLISDVYNTAIASLKDYLLSYPTWKKWAQNTINESKRSGDYAVLVDKYSRKCYIYLAGAKKYEFDAELGRNWVGDKKKMGDKATPEGNYKIVYKYQGRETLYHKALSIDYPNAEDKERFRNEVARGILPRSSKIGGGIEIHGGGGKGVDWTEGCIALKNSEVDIVYSILKVGTPVTIVGSLKKFDEILVN
jgi:L,D-peptidoglycan transpeptidase YkuD (ErfK/YbiS/YcfS/YnhG family)